MAGSTTGLDDVFDSAVGQSVDDALVRRGLNTVVLLVGDLIRADTATPNDYRRFFMAWHGRRLQHAPSRRYRFAERDLAPPEAVG